MVSAETEIVPLKENVPVSFVLQEGGEENDAASVIVSTEPASSGGQKWTSCWILNCWSFNGPDVPALESCASACWSAWTPPPLSVHVGLVLVHEVHCQSEMPPAQSVSASSRSASSLWS